MFALVRAGFHRRTAASHRPGRQAAALVGGVSSGYGPVESADSPEMSGDRKMRTAAFFR
ncbi:hypothetical protein JL107_12835 [Nakamurella flavida]|uniref:Uncharacterized protein n=1 Tax=Nakamurella flavida TaxID=363630 RepID=A0A939C3S2_9ACTN|nr:hypothetical protein [Nakamurella flavida]MBM9477331.1 hypothetical protein [Nakamurella flavida]MDP9779787.1 hypothetical protein [Nakamurella flavida]